MNNLDAVGQKLKGKAQQLQGEINQQSGNNIKGGMQKLKGKANESMADARLKMKNGRKNRAL